MQNQQALKIQLKLKTSALCTEYKTQKKVNVFTITTTIISR